MLLRGLRGAARTARTAGEGVAGARRLFAAGATGAGEEGRAGREGGGSRSVGTEGAAGPLDLALFVDVNFVARNLVPWAESGAADGRATHAPDLGNLRGFLERRASETASRASRLTAGFGFSSLLHDVGSPTDLARALGEVGVNVRTWPQSHENPRCLVPSALSAELVFAAASGTPRMGGVILLAGSPSYVPAMVRAAQLGSRVFLATSKHFWRELSRFVDASNADIRPLLLDDVLPELWVPLDEWRKRGEALDERSVALALAAALSSAAVSNAPAATAAPGGALSGFPRNARLRFGAYRLAAVLASSPQLLRSLRLKGITAVEIAARHPDLFDVNRTHPEGFLITLRPRKAGEEQPEDQQLSPLQQQQAKAAPQRPPQAPSKPPSTTPPAKAKPVGPNNNNNGGGKSSPRPQSSGPAQATRPSSPAAPERPAQSTTAPALTAPAPAAAVEGGAAVPLERGGKRKKGKDGAKVAAAKSGPLPKEETPKEETPKEETPKEEMQKARAPSGTPSGSAAAEEHETDAEGGEDLVEHFVRRAHAVHVVSSPKVTREVLVQLLKAVGGPASVKTKKEVLVERVGRMHAEVEAFVQSKEKGSA